MGSRKIGVSGEEPMKVLDAIERVTLPMARCLGYAISPFVGLVLLPCVVVYRLLGGRFDTK